MPALAKNAGITTGRTSALDRSRTTERMNGIQATTRRWTRSVRRVRRVVEAGHT
jgi:hypothetical protein